ncbi:type IV secretory system conjugative DNA transfer family protein [Telmatospirillum siberiense]|nr:type IV secretory system conjugative DNA transfer family protein [Telmatospirillum siberiense]
MAAASYGIRGGLARRTWEINKELERQTNRLSGIYNFAPLVIPLPEGGSVIPPVVEDGDQAMSVSGDGTDMKASKKVLRIVRPAHISPIIPNWRVYLVRYWPAPEIPRNELMPQTDEEKAAWSKWVAGGWEIGVRQANDIFRVNTDRLTRDMVGMALYHRLVAQGMIHDLYIDQRERGVTGGGDTLHIGERIVRITAPAQLNPKTGEWSPIILDQP